MLGRFAAKRSAMLRRFAARRFPVGTFLCRVSMPGLDTTAVRAVTSQRGEVGGVEGGAGSKDVTWLEGGAGSKDLSAQQDLSPVDQIGRNFHLSELYFNELKNLRVFYAGEIEKWQAKSEDFLSMFKQERQAKEQERQAKEELNAQLGAEIKLMHCLQVQSLVDKHEWKEKEKDYMLQILILKQNLHLRGAFEFITNGVFIRWVAKKQLVVVYRMGAQEILNRIMDNDKFSAFFNCMTEKFVMNCVSCQKRAHNLYDRLSATQHGGVPNVPFQLTGQPEHDLVVGIFLEYFFIPYTVYDHAGNALPESPYSEWGKTCAKGMGERWIDLKRGESQGDTVDYLGQFS